MRKTPHYAQGELIEIPRPEAVIQRQIVDYLRAQNYLVIRLNSLCTKIGSRYVRAYWVFGLTHPSKGAMDIMAFRGTDAPILIEVKKAKGVRSDVQAAFADYALTKGVSVLCVRSVNEVIEHLKTIE